MSIATRETVTMKTPRGHDVLAELDYENFSVYRAKVVHGFTGVIKPLEGEAVDNLARALRARQLYEAALKEKQAVEKTVEGFGKAISSLDHRHPAVEPYWREMEQHETIAHDMGERARHFHETAMKAIDLIAGD
jgi:hypothetical protein